MGVGSTSNGSIEANANTHAPLAADQVLDLLPGHSTQNPPRLVPANTERSLPLLRVGRARTGSAPGPEDSRNSTPGAGALVLGGLAGAGETAPPRPRCPPPPYSP